MTLKEKINTHFEGKVVRKDLTKEIKGNAVVPGYVLEYLLGQHCASSDPEIVHLGLEKVRNIIANHFVHRDEAEKVKNDIHRKENHTIIDKVAVRFNDRKGVFEATLSNLNLKKILVDSETVNRHKKLLTNGVWCIVKLAYHQTDEKDESPWLMLSLKPIQISNSNVEEYKSLRKNFTTEEWMALLMQSLGLNAEAFNFRTMLIQFSRLIPFCENNYNFIELGPKGTGKSHVFSELSPHGILISGGDVTQAKLFVNNSNGQIGLVGFWDVVAFDEFAGSGKTADKKLVDIMKNYMANKSFSRGTDVFSATASMVFVGNTEHSVGYMMKNSNLFDALPKAYYDTAFLDRIHAYIPGWEVSKLRNEMFTSEYGFIVDYLAEILRELRKEDFTLYFKDRIEFDNSITTRDKTAIYKSIAGFIKIIFPDGSFTAEELRQLADFSVEMRKRVKNQLVKMDETFEEVNFSYTEAGSGHLYSIETLEELNLKVLKEENENNEIEISHLESEHAAVLVSKVVHIKDNQTGITYKNLFGAYLKEAKSIKLIDPYIRMVHQFERLAEFCIMLSDFADESNEISLHVITWNDEDKKDLSNQNFTELAESLENLNIKLSWELCPGHDRSIKTDTGWLISLGRGLDIYERPDSKFDIAGFLQKSRKCKACDITYNRVG
jgi:ATP-dependent Lon protease